MNHQPVCVRVSVSPTNNFWTDQWIFMKFGRPVMPLKMTSMSHFNIVASAIPKLWTFKLLRWVQLLIRFVDLDEILYGGDGIEYYLDYILFNYVFSTIPKWRTFKLLSWMQLLNRLVELDEILYRNNDIKGDLYH
jgi:hypothetical protein